MAQIDLPFAVNRQYKDLSLSFTKNPVTSDVVTVTGADAVKRAIRNILATRPGEVPFMPNFGTRLDALLFEPIDPITTAQIELEIRGSIKAFEPRARIITLQVTPTVGELQYQVDLTIQIINLPEPVTLTVFITRLR